MGAALLQDPDELADLVAGIVSGVPDLPVSVKVRTGVGPGGVSGGVVETRGGQATGKMSPAAPRDSNEQQETLGINICKVIEAVVGAGASAVSIHGRTRQDICPEPTTRNPKPSTNPENLTRSHQAGSL
jgi:tRNA-dihydrouridine synthase